MAMPAQYDINTTFKLLYERLITLLKSFNFIFLKNLKQFCDELNDSKLKDELPT